MFQLTWSTTELLYSWKASRIAFFVSTWAPKRVSNIQMAVTLHACNILCCCHVKNRGTYAVATSKRVNEINNYKHTLFDTKREIENRLSFFIIFRVIIVKLVIKDIFLLLVIAKDKKKKNGYLHRPCQENAHTHRRIVSINDKWSCTLCEVGNLRYSISEKHCGAWLNLWMTIIKGI